MIKRIIEISSAHRHLSVRLGQLIIKENGAQISSMPCEDIGLLLVDHPGVTYTHSVFTELLKEGAAVVLCGGSHHPAGMLLPLESNCVQSERFRAQIGAKEPVKKQLWRQVVRAKIKHQAKVVGEDSAAYGALMALRDKVRSGDTSNIEAQASRKYWRWYLSGEFRRDAKGAPPNNMLNYGYMVMRAAVARALCSGGLLPTLGIHHHNRYNAFCLADDMMEPLRGFVEGKVKKMWEAEEQAEDLSQAVKAELLEVLYEAVSIGGYKGPLMVGLHRTMASLQRCLAGTQKVLDLPEL